MPVTVYSQPNCQPCVQVKKWLTNNEVEFVEKDISTDENALTEIIELGFNSTPVVVTESDQWAGINLHKMKELVA